MISGIDWRFPLLLILAFLLNLWFTWLQMRRYNREVNQVLNTLDGDYLTLCTGQGRSWHGGIIVICVVNTRTHEVVYCRAMRGRTVFAGFTAIPEALGPVSSIAERVTGTQTLAAFDMAFAQLTKNAVQHASRTPHRMVARSGARGVRVNHS